MPPSYTYSMHICTYLSPLLLIFPYLILSHPPQQRSTAASRARTSRPASAAPTSQRPAPQRTPSSQNRNRSPNMGGFRSDQQAAAAAVQRTEQQMNTAPTPKSALSRPATAPLARFTIKQETQRQQSPTPEFHAYAEERSPRATSPLMPRAEFLVETPYNSYRIDQHGVAATPPPDDQPTTPVTNRQSRKSVMFADSMPPPPSPVPATVTVPTKPDANEESRTFTQLLNESELEYIMGKAMAEPPMPGPAPGAQGDLDRATGSGVLNTSASPREPIRADDFLAAMAGSRSTSMTDVADAPLYAAAPAPAPAPEPTAVDVGLDVPPPAPLPASPPPPTPSALDASTEAEAAATPDTSFATPVKQALPQTPSSIFRSAAPNTGIYAPVLGSSPLTGARIGGSGRVGSNPPLPRSDSSGALSVTSPTREPIAAPLKQAEPLLPGALMASPPRPAPGVSQPLTKTPSNELKSSTVQYSLLSDA